MPAVWVFWGPGEDHLIAAVIQVGNHGGPYHGAAPPVLVEGGNGAVREIILRLESRVLGESKGPPSIWFVPDLVITVVTPSENPPNWGGRTLVWTLNSAPESAMGV
jgi:hypothetical protein